jgi:hypothetical protein
MELSSKEKKAAKAFARLGGLKGGKARAEALTPEERQEIARDAARTRWAKEGKPSMVDFPHATHEGILEIGSVKIPCAVLHTGQRVLTQSGFMQALGRARQAKGRGYYDADVNMPAFLTAKNLKRFISQELQVTSSQIEFKPLKGHMAFGYPAELLPKVCDVFLDAEAAQALTPGQKHIAERAHILIRGLAHVGIIALVDEATGYQEVRDRLALQAILDQYLRKEFAKWAKQFPAEFYQGIFRLRNWQWRGMKVNPPQIVAHYTKDLVYARLAPRIVKELEVRNPMTEQGYRKHKHYQYLTEDIGLPALAQHLYAVTGLMRAADTWGEFMELIDKAHPRRGDTLQLPLFDGDNFESEE